MVRNPEDGFPRNEAHLLAFFNKLFLDDFDGFIYMYHF